ncbi:LexA repressor [Candidatus Hydrogenisulfobacillus filiaventi]|uniref:LexA repressor n=1 Tax=Candidatus Hydrogenisulfobacillus filiaventi TaxID=2707344 RepID=A0A6F8ZG41_9FIRM|nr:transcriptional repressor LexA [Bacillota bacterium]CAB1128851.1 LexA repressor [Candidatus Hydrogenisulfobacillus filiaventi]
MARRSDRREQILAYIEEHIQSHGYPPSVREIGAAVGLRSSASVFRHLRILEAGGRLTHQPSKRRAWQLDPGRAGGPAGAEVALVPLLGRITAGVPILAQEQVEDHLAVPRHLFHGRPDFLLRVMGDSMQEAGILDGDLVVVQAQPAADEGDIIIALLENEATVKRLHLTREGPWLMPANPRYQPLFAPDLKVLGRVIGLLRGY